MEHDHTHEEDGVLGIAIGIRIIEEGGELFLAEAEISPYIDDPAEIGATLVFHPLAGLNPIEDPDSEWDSWPIDIDDDLTIDGSAGMREQFAAIVRQLYQMSEAELREYLGVAREEADNPVP